MSGKDNGGPAFPYEGGTNNGLQPHYGMTLRDYFAVKAIQGILSGDWERHGDVFGVVTQAFKIADAALSERTK